MNGVERPLDLLNSLKGEDVIVNLKNTDNKIEGTLLAFDIHIKLVIKNKEKQLFIRGDIIETVSPK